MRLTREFQPIHITIESKEEAQLFQDIFKTYLKNSSRCLFGSHCESEKEYRAKCIYEYLCGTRSSI